MSTLVDVVITITFAAAVPTIVAIFVVIVVIIVIIVIIVIDAQAAIASGNILKITQSMFITVKFECHAMPITTKPLKSRLNLVITITCSVLLFSFAGAGVDRPSATGCRSSVTCKQPAPHHDAPIKRCPLPVADSTTRGLTNVIVFTIANLR
jgi:hypothetical protein